MAEYIGRTEMGKVHIFQDNEMLTVEKWSWSDFKSTWEDLVELYDEETAWQMIFQLWKVRAGEVKE